MNTWFTSDLHVGHLNIISYCNRPFKDVNHMNRELIARWNSVVSDGDVVWVLGDFVMGKKDETMPLLEQLNGQILLVPGNHDRCHPMDKRSAEWVDRFADVGVTVMPTELELPNNVITGGTPLRISMCHFPFEGDSHDEDRYSHLRPVDTGQLLLHGHVHDMWQVRGNQINVGCDVWNFQPVTLEDLVTAWLHRND